MGEHLTTDSGKKRKHGHLKRLTDMLQGKDILKAAQHLIITAEASLEVRTETIKKVEVAFSYIKVMAYVIPALLVIDIIIGLLK